MPFANLIVPIIQIITFTVKVANTLKNNLQSEESKITISYK